MIWIVTTPNEKDSLIPDRKLAVIKDTVGEVERIICQHPSDLLKVSPLDTVLVETKDYSVIEQIAATGARHTGESLQAIKFEEDKLLLKAILAPLGIPSPKIYPLTDKFNDDKIYFVKPLILEDSIGIDEQSLCYNRYQVLRKVDQIRERYGRSSIVEEYIEGTDCTVAVIRKGNDIFSYPIRIIPNAGCDYLSYDAKTADRETYERIIHSGMTAVAETVFRHIGAINYARIDFRVDKDGIPYVLEVNLYPGLSNTGYMYRCFELNDAATYPEMLKAVLATARNTNPFK